MISDALSLVLDPVLLDALALAQALVQVVLEYAEMIVAVLAKEHVIITAIKPAKEVANIHAEIVVQTATSFSFK